MNNKLMLDFFSEHYDKNTLKNNFKLLVSNLKFDDEFIVSSSSETVGSGREGIIAKIYKKNWVGKQMILKNGVYEIGADTFNIHYELGLDLLNKRITFPLHYETNEYVPKQELMMTTRKEKYNEYTNFRNKIKTIIHSEIMKIDNKNIKKFNGSNTIVRIKIDITDSMTIDEFNNYLNELISITSRMIDYSLNVKHMF